MHQTVTPDLANQVVFFAMMCARTYLSDETDSRFPIERFGWRKVNHEGRPVEDRSNSYYPKTCWGRLFSNLQFDIWEHKETSDTVIAFKGTDEPIDWLSGNAMLGISIPYKSAKKHALNYQKRFPNRKLMLTGHSLGGGLALSVSVWHGMDAIVFNSSPRIFDGCRNMNKPASRMAIFQEQDPLQLLRARWPKFLSKIPDAAIYRTDFDYGAESNHRMDLLADGLVQLSTLPELLELQSMERKKN